MCVLSVQGSSAVALFQGSSCARAVASRARRAYDKEPRVERRGSYPIRRKCQCAVSRDATRSSIHACTSSETHATRQAPSPALLPRPTRRGRRRAVPAGGIGRRLRVARCAQKSTARQRRTSVPSCSPVAVSSDTPSKGSIAMLARNQLAGNEEHTSKCVRVQRAHSFTCVTERPRTRRLGDPQ